MSDPMIDKAMELGRMLGQTPEYKALGKARERLTENRVLLERLNSLAKLESEIARALQRGEEPAETVQDRYEKLFTELQTTPEYAGGTRIFLFDVARIANPVIILPLAILAGLLLLSPCYSCSMLWDFGTALHGPINRSRNALQHYLGAMLATDASGRRRGTQKTKSSCRNSGGDHRL